MDTTLRKICGLLGSEDHMRQCAAAIALAEVAPKDAEVVKALGTALGQGGPILASYILGALEAIGSPEAAPYLLPLLEADDLQLTLRAAACLARAGNRVVPDVRRRLEQAGSKQKRVLVDLLARVHTADALDAVLETLFDPDAEFVKEAGEAVRRHLGDAAPAARAALHKRAAAFLKTPRVQARERAAAACLLVLGHIGRPEAGALLLKYAQPGCAPCIRRHALLALKSLELKGAAAAAVARALPPYLGDPDEGVARQALEALDRLPASGLSDAGWAKLLDSPHAALRTCAARKLAGIDTAAGNRRLIGMLRHGDTEVRELAAAALSAHAAAAPLVLEALTAEKDPDAAWRLARVLKPFGEAFDARALKPLSALTARALANDDPRHEPLLYALRGASPKAADGVLVAAGMEYKRAGEWARAVNCLRRLANTESFDDEARFALSVCNLKLSPKVLDPAVRLEDHALRGLHVLLRDRAFDLLERLKKDKALDAGDLYYAAFHFAEGPAEDREFGERLLEHVARTWPRTTEGKAAKNKLKITHPGGRKG